MSGFPRDLAALEPWEASLARSRARRRYTGGGRAAAHSLSELLDARNSARAVRDLSDSEPWEMSLGRSRTRRRAVELQFVPTTSRARRISLGTLVALAAGPAAGLADANDMPHPTTPSGPEPPTTTEHNLALTSGSSGRQVRLLQHALGISVDGVYGSKTEAAVREFQASRGLTVDDIVGPITSAALRDRAPARVSAVKVREELTGKTRREEEAAKALMHLQGALQLQADGTFGPETEAAVRRLQAREGLTVDGVVGPATWGALGIHGQGTLTPPPSALPVAHPPKTAPAKHTSGAPTNPILLLQQALHVQADGTFGAETEAAVRSLQAREGLPVDGVVGPATWSALGVNEQRTLEPPASRAPHAQGGTSGESSGGQSNAGGESSGTQSDASGESHPVSTAGGGESSGVVERVIAAADQIANAPYVYGGGHGSFQSTGYDCSGSVSYALHGGGLLSSPEDSSELESYGEPGPGQHITIYANAGHAFMVIDGRRFDTVAQQESGSRWAGSTSSTGGYVARHPAGL